MSANSACSDGVCVLAIPDLSRRRQWLPTGSQTWPGRRLNLDPVHAVDVSLAPVPGVLPGRRLLSVRYSLGSATLAVLLLAAGYHLEKAGTRRFLGIVAICSIQIISGLSRVGDGNASGLTIAVLTIAALVLAMRPSARAYLRNQ